MLHSSKQFAVDLHYMKVKFYYLLTAYFTKLAGSKMNLWLYIWFHHSAGHTCYATECRGLTATQMRSLRNTWQCAVSHIFNVRGTNVNFICATTDNASLDTVIATRSIKFLQSLQDVHGQHPVLHNLYARIGKRELFCLRTLRDDWSVIFAWYFLLFMLCVIVCLFSFIFSLIVYFLSAALWRIKILYITHCYSIATEYSLQQTYYPYSSSAELTLCLYNKYWPTY